MFILLTIFLLLLIALVMLILRLIRPRFSIQGFLATVAIIAGWLMVFIARSDIPETISLFHWQPASLFPISPILQIDPISWYSALALVSLSLALMITSIAQIGQSAQVWQPSARNDIDDPDAQAVAGATNPTRPRVDFVEHNTTSSWRSWAGILVVTSFGLVAVTAGNLLTLVLAWAALDMIELLTLLGRTLESKARERIILSFFVRMAGIGLVLLAGIIPWSHGESLSFDAINQSTGVYLILATGLRLGVLPLHMPIIREVPLRRGLGTLLRLAPAASSYILLIRIAQIGILTPVAPYLLFFTALAGLYAAFNWLIARDELNGQPFWVFGTASLVVASAILNQPMACLAWSIASLLSGGFIFSFSIPHRYLLPLVVLGIINFSALPFSPTWLGYGIFLNSSTLAQGGSPFLFYLLSFVYLIIHALLLAGFYHHALRGIIFAQEGSPRHIERWVWFLYPIGLIIIAVTHAVFSLFNPPNPDVIPFLGWIMGAIALVISGLILYFYGRFPKAIPPWERPEKSSPLGDFLSLDWLYRNLWNLFRLLSRAASVLSRILEGDGGILWALVLFALIFVFLQR